MPLFTGRPIDYVRMSRGNPSFAKPVQIPVVPDIPRPERTNRRDSNNGVPPEQVKSCFIVSTVEQKSLFFFFGKEECVWSWLLCLCVC